MTITVHSKFNYKSNELRSFKTLNDVMELSRNLKAIFSIAEAVKGHPQNLWEQLYMPLSLALGLTITF